MSRRHNLFDDILEPDRGHGPPDDLRSVAEHEDPVGTALRRTDQRPPDAGHLVVQR
jgi:hypothetical protein